MKNYSILVLLIFSLFACNSTFKKDGFTVEGTITNGSGKELVLSKLTTQKVIPVDTVKLDEKGNFKFTGHASSPDFYILSISQNEYINLLIDSMQQITVNADASKFTDSYTVKGSPDSQLLKELYDRLAKTVGEIDSLGIIFRTMQTEKNADSLRAAINPKLINSVSLLNKDTKKFIDANPLRHCFQNNTNRKERRFFACCYQSEINQLGKSSEQRHKEIHRRKSQFLSHAHSFVAQRCRTNAGFNTSGRYGLLRKSR